MKKYIFGITIIYVISLQGCSWFTSPKEQPVIEDKVGVRWGKGYKVGTLATTPERRVVIVNLDNGKFCAEPPADAGENLASSFAVALEGTDGKISAKAELAKAFASSVKQLFQRSQGVQLYRDGMYSLCQAYLNGAIDTAQFDTKQKELLDHAKGLIEKEIPYLPYLKVDPIQAPTPPATPKLSGKVEEAQQPDPATPGNGAPAEDEGS